MRVAERALLSLRRARPSVLLWTALLCLALASCSNSPAQTRPSSSAASSSVAATTGAIDHPVVTMGCGHPSLLPPGTSADQTLTVNPADSLGRHTRTYRLHVPSSYQQDHPQPLVLILHGYGGTATGTENGSGWTPFADQHDALVAYPQGLPDGTTEGEQGPPFWANVGPMDYGVDDVHYISLLLDDLQHRFCVDARRLYVTGFSNGGGMTGLLACTLAGRLAAVAPVAGNFYDIPGGCHPSRPLPILDIHGSADPVLPYQGIPASEDPPWPLPPIPQWLQGWAARDGCHSVPEIFARNPQILGERWTSCQGVATVVHYRVEGGGHAIPAKLGDRSTLDVMWDFFMAHPLPA